MSSNLSFFAVPAAFWCAHWPHLYTVLFAGTYDNANPRALKDTLASTGSLDNERKQMFLRAKRASENGYETLGLFAAAIAAANQAGVEVSVLNRMAWGYVAVRIAYNFAYIRLGGIPGLHLLRTFFWVNSMFLSVGLFVAAGFKAKDAIL
ncbi:hypothetical protein B0I35DRAFT_446622 [Stachybotrys elegans]|uniref:Uncharacterized protein n=1 Tax=Stachybotrys elegans TaxID=80388 RepID=A0A8K0SDR8_9HYPO|nr:hypothetical protein B0I35DRAFT_446622 [Stachybotrys elegans]